MKELKKNIGFNARLYLDGLRQLKIIGILSAIIMAVAAFAIPMGRNISNAQYYRWHYMDEYFLNGNDLGRVVSYNIFFLNPFIILTFLILVPLMTMMLFSFLNRRNACDFYHGIPVTRETLLLSYGASILTWNVAIALESIAVTGIAAGIFRYVTLEWGEVPVLLCALVAADIFMMGVFIISMSLTGTLVTNLCVAAMILVVPRAFITYILAVVTESISVIDFRFGDTIFDDRLNVVTNLITGEMIRGRYQAWSDWKSVLYTLVVGLIWCVIGMYLFKKRKSEAATQAAITPRLQAVFRIVPAMLISLLPLYYFYNYFIAKSDLVSMDEESIFVIGLMYLIAVISIFVYEFVTTRRFKNFKRALKSIVGLVVYNVAMLAVLGITYTVMLNDIPGAEDVRSLQIEGIDGHFQNFSSENQTFCYVANHLGDVTITTEEMKQLILSELERNVECQKRGNSDSSMHAYYNDKEWRFSHIWVSLECKGGTKVRYIALSKEASQKLIELLSKEEAVRSLVYNPLPTEEFDFVSDQLSEEDQYKIYSTYMKELGKLTFEDAFLESIGDVDYNQIINSIWMRAKDGEGYRLILTPNFAETVKIYCDQNNEKDTKGENPVEEFLRNYRQDKALVCDGYVERGGVIRMTTYHPEDDMDKVICSTYYDIYGAEDGSLNVNKDFTENGEKVLEQIGENLSKCDDQTFDTSKPYVEVTFTFYENTLNQDGKYENEDRVRTHFYNVDEETVELLWKLGGYSEKYSYDGPTAEVYGID